MMFEKDEHKQSQELFTTLFLAGVDWGYIFERIYLYCEPGEGQIERTIREIRRIAGVITGITKHIRRAEEQLKSDCIQPPASLRKAIEILEKESADVTAMSSIRHDLRTMFLIEACSHMRSISKRHHHAFARLATLITDGYECYRVDDARVVSGDDIRKICARFKKKFPG